MKVYTSLQAYKRKAKKPLILALGNFDGIHLGHRLILEHVVRRAKRLNGNAAALTFHEHPQRILKGGHEPALLSPPEQRLSLLKALGLDTCFLMHFTMPFSRITAETFVKEFLWRRLGVREVYLGSNARFGAGRRGDSVLMRRMGRQLGFCFHEIKPVKRGGQIVSSSRIRELVKAGELKMAALCLGRPLSFFARVIKGKGRGRQLGFPTANLRVLSEVLPPPGVYPVEVQVCRIRPSVLPRDGAFRFDSKREGPLRIGVMNLGTRPTFEPQEKKLIPEIFILDFEGNLYGKTTEVRFYPALRPEKKFRSAEELTRAIKQDVSRVRNYFSRRRLTDPKSGR